MNTKPTHNRPPTADDTPTIEIVPLDDSSETPSASPGIQLSQPPSPKKENDSPLCANFGTNHGSREAQENNASAVTGSQAPSGQPDLAAFAAAAETPLDPEDLTAFALPDDFESSVAKRVLTTVSVRKPSKESFVRTNPDPMMWRPYSDSEGIFFVRLGGL